MSIRTKLVSVLVALTLALAFTNWMSFSGASAAKASLNTIYADRVVPMRDLKDMSDAYAVSIVDTTHKVRNGGLSAAEGLRAVNDAQSNIKKLWDGYTATYLVPEEKTLVAKANPLMATAGQSIEKLKRILSTDDKAALDDFVRHELYQNIDPITGVVSELINLQVGVVETEFKSATDRFDRNNLISMVLLAASVATVLFGGFTIISGVVRPMNGLTVAMTSLAKSDWTTVVPALGRHDEIGTMAKAVEVFKSNGISAERMRTEQEELKKQAEIERHEVMISLADNFESLIGGIVQSVTAQATELQTTAEVMSSTARETSAQSTNVAAASEEATSNVQTVASATEELSSSVREIQQRVGQSNALVQIASQQAKMTNTKVQGLTEAANKIGDVVQLISDIAAQTNLLALNATIEAARAGEMGKGFAVVASEVKNLAGQTARATEEISHQIKSIQDETKSSAEAIHSITKAIEDINHTASAIAAAIEEQGSATQEIARNVNEAAHGTQEVSLNIAQVSEATQRTGAAATQVLSAAGELAKNGENLKFQVTKFLKEVRTA